MSRPIRATFAVVLMAYLAFAGFAPLTGLDRVLLPDDTYYTLSIARNIAAGLGPSADGVVLTSGFQPLIALLMQPVFWLGLDGDGALRAVILLSSGFGALACLFAGRITAAATGSESLGALALGLSGASSLLLYNALNGLETTLAATLVLWLISLAMGTDRDAPVWRLMAVGAVAGLAIWARIDSALAILILAAVALIRIGPARTGLVALAALIVAAPWLGYCLTIGGQPLPESGGAVRQILDYHFETGVDPGLILLDALRLLPRVLLPDSLILGLSLPALIALHLPLALPLVQAIRAGRMDAPAVLVLLALALLAFYLLYLPAFWFFHRYLHLAGLGMIVALVVGLGRLGSGRAALVATVLLLVAQLAQTGGRAYAIATVPAEARWGHGYADVARRLLPLLPAGATLAAMQSGALTWHAPPGIRVVNLDGVVNSGAKAAIASRSLDLYLAEIGATHFADWPFNRNWLLSRSQSPLTLTPIGALADHNGPGQDFTLYLLD